MSITYRLLVLLSKSDISHKSFVTVELIYRLEDSNVTAVEAISERLAEVTSLAEGLDTALCGSRGEETSVNMDKILNGTASTTPEVSFKTIQ